MNLEEAVTILRKELKRDPGLFISYQSNIAIAFKDAYQHSENKEDIHTIANDAAKNFLDIFIRG